MSNRIAVAALTATALVGPYAWADESDTSPATESDAIEPVTNGVEEGSPPSNAPCVTDKEAPAVHTAPAGPKLVAPVLQVQPAVAMADGAATTGGVSTMHIPETASSQAPSVVYKHGFKLQTSDGKYALGISGRLQSRYSYDAVHDETDPTQRVDEGELAIERARLTFGGKAQELSYKIQVDFAEGFKLKDFYADYQPTQGPVRIRVGQFKRPSSRQHIASSGALDLVDRSITHKAFKNLRDTGIALHNDYETSPRFEWVVGLFGAKEPGPVSTQVEPLAFLGEHLNPAVVARVGYNHGGLDGYKEADLEGGPLRFGVGLGGTLEFDGEHDNHAVTRTTLDYIAKVHGFAATGAVFLASMQEGSDFGSQGLDAGGFYQQVGYVIGGRVQPAVRYGYVDYKGPLDTDTHELTAGLSFYQSGHSFKLNTDATAFFPEGADGADYQVRTQLQLVF